MSTVLIKSQTILHVEQASVGQDLPLLSRPSTLAQNLPILFDQHDIGMIIGDADPRRRNPLIQSYDDTKVMPLSHAPP